MCTRPLWMHFGMEVQARTAEWQAVSMHLVLRFNSAAVFRRDRSNLQLHREHDAELRVAAGHAFISLGCFFQRNFSIIGRTPVSAAKAWRLRIGGCAGSQPAAVSFPSKA